MKNGIVLAGRILFAAIFINSGLFHFSAQSVAYANSQGVLMANILVPFSGLLAVVGGLMIATGFKAKLGAWILVIFLLPVTFMMHKFWAVSDPMMKGMQMAMFMKNMALTGGALLLTYFGAGPISIDSMMEKKKN